MGPARAAYPLGYRRCGSVFLARAAFEEAIKQWPDQKLTLRQGIMLISEHPAAKPEPAPKRSLASLISHQKALRENPMPLRWHAAPFVWHTVVLEQYPALASVEAVLRVLEFVEAMAHEHHLVGLQLDHDDGIDHDRHDAFRIPQEIADSRHEIARPDFLIL